MNVSIRRGAGFCQSMDCRDYAKGVFLLNPSNDVFTCPCCRGTDTHVEIESGRHANDHEVVKEVRVEYNYDPVNGNYRDTAIVRDEAIPGRANVYTFRSPLIKTEQRALKIAEAMLANSHWSGRKDDDFGYRETEIILHFDNPMEKFLDELAVLEQRLCARKEREARLR